MNLALAGVQGKLVSDFSSFLWHISKSCSSCSLAYNQRVPIVVFLAVCITSSDKIFRVSGT